MSERQWKRWDVIGRVNAKKVTMTEAARICGISLRQRSEVDAPGPRFENLVACHLLKACDYWTDSGKGSFELRLLRNRETEEIDFLIVRDKQPWLAVEAKVADPSPLIHWRKFLRYLGTPLALQLVASPGVWQEHRIDQTRLVVASAGEALRYFV